MPFHGHVLTEEDRQVIEVNKTFQNEAEKIVIDKFPRKINELTELIDSELFKLNGTKSSQVDIPVPCDRSPGPNVDCSNTHWHCQKARLLFPDGLIEPDKIVTEMMVILNPLLLDLLQDTVTLELGVALSVPQVEDGNTFGIDIQNSALQTVVSAKENHESYMTYIRTYYDLRGLRIMKVVFWPHSGDYRQALKVTDDNMIFTIRFILICMRDTYAFMYDYFRKNLDKITRPKGDLAMPYVN